jgi:hypothetical protein
MELTMFGAMFPTPSGTWFYYPWRGLRLAAHATAPGKSGLTVLWKGDPAIHDLGVFFESAAQLMNTSAPYDVWVINPGLANQRRVEYVVPIAPEFLVDAQFVRFECRPETEARESPLIVWANLDREVSPEQESIGVYLHEKDIPNLEDEISKIVVRTAVNQQTRLAAKGDLEREVREMLGHVSSDLHEAAQLIPGAIAGGAAGLTAGLASYGIVVPQSERRAYEIYLERAGQVFSPQIGAWTPW